MAEEVKREKKLRTSKFHDAKKEKQEKKNNPKKSKNGAGTDSSQAFSLLADEKIVDRNLSSLFATPAPVVPRTQSAPVPEAGLDSDADVEADAELSELDDQDVENGDEDLSAVLEAEPLTDTPGAPEKRCKRKRNDDDDLEGAYLERLARGEEKDAKRAAAERAEKRQKVSVADENPQDGGTAGDDAPGVAEEGEGEGEDDDDDGNAASSPPKHETEIAADEDLEKAKRTVFIGNVSTSAISSKSARKELIKHLSSFFKDLPTKDGEPKQKLESLRFRSTPYAAAVPKKAAYARKELMDATTKSTNAYAVYSSTTLSREAAKRLNGTVVLDRHLRVDEVAHPAKTDHRRCIFVGNLGFVDDESNIQDANEEDGREKRKKAKEPADIEEGLWRVFGRCGNVESVRVIRDSTTRVGKGIAYVQFDSENAVEAALLYNEKKFPPMLPRKLRVDRAKAMKKNAKPGSGRPGAPKPSGTGYNRKITGEEASQMGRAGKLYGRAAASQMRGTRPQKAPLGNGIRKPEDFVFEGHRASSKSGKAGLKLGGKKKGGKPTSRSAKRGAAFKAGGGQKKSRQA
ncbi:hypothetical protein EJ03DRAFT_330047 [Teratosphaeria nubilosa]|uniref:Nucleolar protein 12 n=1 Tax=Teratosphaeria nubilosa TaxID=161662 RepID=A0A6G1L292_9PEZI|nr:hypothetical protein EJ03DRAFT_330047 [Teratosphaeria nubilosa]